MDLIDTVLEGDNRSYFTCGHGDGILYKAEPDPNPDPDLQKKQTADL